MDTVLPMTLPTGFPDGTCTQKISGQLQKLFHAQIMSSGLRCEHLHTGRCCVTPKVLMELTWNPLDFMPH
uniref:Uncharacterized protein n=1 Tax=Piliocolobus tephrosceles TaxID=591936 RepID=A0A8C9GTH6_9PRIM